MPARKPYSVKFTASSGLTGQSFKVTNLTAGGNKTVTINSAKNGTVDIANLSAYSTGDTIQIVAQGKSVGAATHTVLAAGSGATVSITVADHSFPSLSM